VGSIYEINGDITEATKYDKKVIKIA